ncbi:hypothetical protein [Streptomyces lavendofoliae]|uniref:Uncharacterized protein n=1 Tax=Streptomyces lavendofoliae TaxID=67314 RepID=A0A918I378_9ACTN|nr:hypothetical protein [Streptomyces lavendofoliae]GGU62167.1 hypothetical protein GCM10010274_58670 [Streptomyces lavendofoliae]
MTTITRNRDIPAPYGCRWCGDEKRRHGKQWVPTIGLHSWHEPTQEQIKERMWCRRSIRLSLAPTQYHATTAWAADHTGESADPYCADCKTDGCRPWQRIQDRLNHQRWGLPRVPRGGQPGGWGGYEAEPF